MTTVSEKPPAPGGPALELFSELETTELLAALSARINVQLARFYSAYPPAGLLEGPDGADGVKGAVPRQTREHLARRAHEGLAVPLRELIDSGGQRWRPALVLHTIDFLGGDAERFGQLVAALEAIHAGSLIVDDVEDGAGLRRGRPSVHEAFGMPTALNAGTAAYFALSQAIGETIPHIPQDTASAHTAVRAEMYDAYLSGMLAAHAGQALDIQGHHREFDEALATAENRTLLDCLRVTYSLKSGAMEGVSLQIAALAGGATRELARALREFGTAMGTAYQTSDDVADLYGVPRNGRATKRIGEDLHNAKVTMPLAHAVALLPSDRLRQLWDLISHGGAAPETVREVVAELERCGAVAACAHEARTRLDDAWRVLEPQLPDTPRAGYLHAIARYVVERNLLHQTAELDH
jgi:geranylgeranyl pyrophosphate synthase